MANSQDFRRFMSPDFQASPQPALDWMPWEDQQQQGTDLGSILGQLKPQGQANPMMGKGGMMPSAEGKPGMMGGGKGSL